MPMPIDGLQKAVTADVDGPRRPRPLGLILSASLVAGWLLVVNLRLMPAAPVVDWITVGLLAAALLLTFESWRGKASARLGLGLLTLMAGAATVTALPFDPANGAAAFDVVILLLIGIGLSRAYLEGQDIRGAIERALSHPLFKRSSRPLFLLYGGMCFLLSLAVVPIVGALTFRTRLNHRYHLRVAMRAVGATMFLAPTTVGAAAVSVNFPELTWSDAVLIGLPLSVATILLSPRRRDDQDTLALDVGERRSRRSTHLAVPLTLFVAVLMVGKVILSLPAVTAVALAVTVAGMVSLAWRHGPVALGRSLQDVIARSSPEILLFIACGTVLTALSSPSLGPWAEAMPELLIDGLSWPPAQALIAVGVLPLLTILGIHPMVLFVAVFPLLHSLAAVAPAVEYHWWIAMFVVAQLVSPVSISAVTAAASVGEAPWVVSLRSHARFAILFGVLCVIYLGALSL